MTRKIPTLSHAQGNPPDVILGQKIYLRKDIWDERDVEARYVLDIFQEATCGRCNNRPNRPNAICDPCPAFEGRFSFYKEVLLRGTRVPYYALPINDITYVKKTLKANPTFRDMTVVNLIDKKMMNNPIIFKGKLFGNNARDSHGNPRANQEEIAATWLKTKCGGIKAPPRTGKTVIGTYLYCELGVKTVIIADKYKLLKQFYDTAMGTMNHENPAKRRPPMTNAPELEEINGRGTSICLLKNTAQLRKFGKSHQWPDVLLMTVQKVTRKLARILQFINPHYSMKIVDEGHGGAAQAYSRALFTMTCPYSLWLSATPRRKDGLDRKSDFTMGPLVAESETVGIPPTVEVKMLETVPDVDYQHWAFACKWARGSEERNNEIVREVFKDLAAGHDVVIVPVGSHGQQKYLIDTINEKIKRLRRRPDSGWEGFPYPLAIELRGSSNQDSVIDRVDDGRPCVLVAQISMIKQGIDMTRPSLVYLNEPFSATKAVGAPMFEQLSFRVATPSPDKPMKPTVKIFVDHISSFRGALRGLWWNEILPGSRKDATPEGPKYQLGEHTYAMMSALGKQRKIGGKPTGKTGGRFTSGKKAPVGGRW